MTCRSTLLALAILLVGCSPDADSQTGTEAGGSGVPPPTGGPVTAIDGERQRLSLAQLVAYLPGTEGRFAVQPFRGGTEDETLDPSGAYAGGTTFLAATYEDTEPRSSYLRFTVSLRDMIDEPRTLERTRREFNQRTFAGRTDGVTAGTAGGLATLEIRDRADGPMLQMLIADRFDVWVQQGSGADAIEDYVAFVESSFIPALATAPAFADAGNPPVPEWAVDGIARSAEQRAREREAREAEAATEGEVAGSLAPCDEILSAAEVSGVLGGASVAVRPTPGVEVDGQNCNRLYKPAGIEGGIILIISHYTNTDQSERALRVASEHDGKVGLQPLAGGLNGVRYTHDLDSDMHISHFALGTDFVELKATAAGESVPEITPGQLAEITAIVARRLRE